MKLIIKKNMVLCNNFMLDIDFKLRIALRLNSEDEELKKLVEIRKDLFVDSYKEDSFEMGNVDKDGQQKEKYGFNDGNKDVVDGEDENHENAQENINVGNGVDTDKLGNDAKVDRLQMDGESNEDGRKDDVAGDKGKNVLNYSPIKGRDEECMKVVGDKRSNEAEYHSETDEADMEKIMKLPMLTTGISDATTSKELLEVENLKRKRSEKFDAKKVNKSVVHVVDAVPVRSFDPLDYILIEKKRKEKTIAARKCKAEVKKGAGNQQPGKPKGGQKKSTKAMEETFNARKVGICETWPKAEMNLVEYIWSDSCDEG